MAKDTLYTANLNAGHPTGTIQSIEHTLRSFERMGEEERGGGERLRKSLAEFQAQAGRPFEHDARLKELLARQSELNAALDLGKGEDRQVAQPDDGEPPRRRQRSCARPVASRCCAWTERTVRTGSSALVALEPDPGDDAHDPGSGTPSARNRGPAFSP